MKPSRVMELSIDLASPITAVATAVMKDGEPNIEVVVFQTKFDPGSFGERSIGESNFGPLTARQFFPFCNCFVYVKDGKIDDAGLGMQNLKGKCVTKIASTIPTTFILIFWETEDQGVANILERNFLKEDMRHKIARMINGLSMAFA